MTVVNILLIVLVAAGNVYCLTQRKEMQIVLMHIVNLILLFVALDYQIHGYRKESIRYLNIYETGLAVFEIIAFVNGFTYYPNAATLVSIGVCFALLCVLNFVKNLGKTVFYVICYVLILMPFAGFIAYTVRNGFGINSTTVYMLTAVLTFSLLFLMIIGKYRDKASRGAK